MKYSLFIVFLFIGISHGFFGSIGQSINNLGNTIESTGNQAIKEVENVVTDVKEDTENVVKEVEEEVENVVEEVENVVTDVQKQVENIVNQLSNIFNGIQFAANFLWDNIFNPTFDMIIAGGQIFLDDKFGAIPNIINGSIALPENPLQDKYAQLVAILKSNIHHLYEQLFLMEQETLKALQNGEVNFEERIRAFYDKLDTIQKQINEWAEVTKYELEVYALTTVGDWTNILNQYKQNIDSVVQSIERMFQQLTQNLMKNILDGVINIIPNATDIIENLKYEGFLSFFQK